MSYIIKQMILGKPYAYRVDAHWDKERKQPKKVSTYVSNPDKKDDLIQGEKREMVEKVRNVFEYGESDPASCSFYIFR